MADLSIQQIAVSGIVPAYTAAANGDTFTDDGSLKTFIHVKNGGGGSINVTIAAIISSINVAGYGLLGVDDYVVAVAAGTEKMIGPFPAAFINTSSKVTINYSGVTTVTAGVFKN